MTKTNLGRVMILPKGDYSASTTYTRLDIVSYQGASYICKASAGVQGVVPTNDLYWQIISQRGEQGDTTEAEAIVAAIRNEIQSMREQGTTDPAIIAKIANLSVKIDGIELTTEKVMEGSKSQKVINAEQKESISQLALNEAKQDQTINGLREQVEKYKPVVINGNVTNAADEEDLTSDNGLLKIKNRSCYYGMGYILLRKNKTFEEQVTQTNTIYEIRYDFDLEGEEVIIPEGCVLKFEGGKIFNGTIIGDGTGIEYKGVVFGSNITISGNWRVDTINSTMFEDLLADNAILNVFALCDNNENKLIVDGGTYYVSRTSNGSCIQLKSNTELILNASIVLRPNNLGHCHIVRMNGVNNVTIKGSGSIVGDRQEHDYSLGEAGYGHGSCIYLSRNCNNVKITGITINEAFTDCILINDGDYIGDGNICSNIVIENCLLNGANRQGISVTHTDNINIYNCRISDVNDLSGRYSTGKFSGAQCGIDVEPLENQYAKNVNINNVYIENCVFGISLIGTHGLVRGIEVCRCDIIGNSNFAISIDNKVDNVTVSNCNIQSRKTTCINIERNSTELLFIGNLISNDGDTDDDNCVIRMQNNSIATFIQNRIIAPNTGVVREGRNLTLKGNIITALKLFYGYATTNINANFSDNTINGEFNVRKADKCIFCNNVITGNVTASELFSNCTFSGNVVNGNLKVSTSEASVFNNNKIYGYADIVGTMVKVCDNIISSSIATSPVLKAKTSYSTISGNYATYAGDDTIQFVVSTECDYTNITFNVIKTNDKAEWGLYTSGNGYNVVDTNDVIGSIVGSNGNKVGPVVSNSRYSTMRNANYGSSKPTIPRLNTGGFDRSNVNIPFYFQKNTIVWDGTGWRDFIGVDVTYANKRIGTTEERIASMKDSGGFGFIFYDTTLKKYVLWNGSAWTNLDGTSL